MILLRNDFVTREKKRTGKSESEITMTLATFTVLTNKISHIDIKEGFIVERLLL